MMETGYHSERLFTDLCSHTFLRGFVFHSPRYSDPTEKEAGDVILWVRREVVVFEVLVREGRLGQGTKQFVKRIGSKRDQLVRNYEVYHDVNIEIRLVNEQAETVVFDKADIKDFGYSGIVIVDCDEPLDHLHFGTINNSLNLAFPSAIMTRNDFSELMNEVDTIPDLSLYIRDRFEFLKTVYALDPRPFLNLSNGLEGNLISFYKIHDNHFPVGEWKPEEAFTFRDKYLSEFQDRIAARKSDNEASYVIDNMIDYLRLNNNPENSTILHAWELASMTRRQRASILPDKLIDALERMANGNPSRHFAISNPITACWLVFFFQYGGDRESFQNKAQRLTRFKLFVEMRKNGFNYSVFGYAFRKSKLETGEKFDELFLNLENAQDYSDVPDDDYREALQYFGRDKVHQVKEFPE